jgi:O-antigen/teichoic acid export membrane protein
LYHARRAADGSPRLVVARGDVRTPRRRFPKRAAMNPSVDARTGMRAILGDVAGFASSQYLLRFTTLIKGFVVAKLLGPAGNGFWQHYSLIFEYGQHGQLGLMEGYNKRIGHMLGRRDEGGVGAARAVGLAGITAGAAVAGLAFCVPIVMYGGSVDPVDRWALPILAVLIVLEQITNCYKALVRAYGRIPLISSVQVRFAISNLVVSLAVLPWAGLVGLMVAWLITRAVTMTWFIRKSGEPFVLAWDRAVLRDLLVTGFPIWLYHLTKLALRNVDRVLVDSVLRKEDLGIYGLAVTLASLVRYGADAIGFVMYPIFLRLYGHTGDPGHLRDHLEEPSGFLAIFVPIVLGFSYLVLHLPVIWLLPDFLPSIEVFRLLTVSIVFSCLSVLPGFYLMAIDRQNLLVPLGAAAVAFNYFAGLAAIRAGWGLPGVAAAAAVGLCLHTTVVLVISGRFARGSVRAAWRWVGEIYAPLAYTSVLVVVLHAGLGPTLLAGWSETARASTEGVLFLAVSAPLLARYEARTGFLAKLRRRSPGVRSDEP